MLRGGSFNLRLLEHAADERERVIRGAGDIVYVLGIDEKAGDYWYIYRPAGAVVTLDGTEVLAEDDDGVDMFIDPRAWRRSGCRC